MRLRDIQHILRAELPGLVVTAEGPFNTPGSGKRFPRRRLEAALRGLRHVHPLRVAAEKALAHKALKEMGEPTTVIDTTFDDFMQNHVQPLNRRGVDLLTVLDDILPKENPLAFAYQLPERERTIDAFVSDVKDLNLVFDEPVARLAGSRTLVIAADRGSILVELAVASGMALLVVTSVCRAAKAVMDVRHTHRKQEAEYASLKLDNRHKSAIVEANEAALAQITRDLSETIVKKYKPDGDNEAANFVQKAVERLADEYEKGARVHLALEAPKDAKELMPKPDDPPLLHEAVLKQLLAVNPIDDSPEAPEASDRPEGEDT